MGRPRGFASWKPKEETLAIIGQVESVLHEYRDHLPLTVRQIFYRLVGQYGYDKTEHAYANLCNHLVRARRSQMISFDVIRDDGTTHNDYARYASPADFWAQTQDHADAYVRDKQIGQPVYVELWCEAAGMVPQLERVANRYSIPVYSTGGFSSVTVTHEIAQRALGRDHPTVFLHVGDFDPSGESIFTSMTEDARQFLYQELTWQLEGEADDNQHARAVLERHWPNNALYPVVELPWNMADLRPTRVALTRDQVEEYGLPTAPPKKSDTRSAGWVGETCQLEAMPPDVLAGVIDGAIQEVLDRELLEQVWRDEDEERVAISAHVAQAIRDHKEG